MGQWGHVLSSISETMRDPSQFLEWEIDSRPLLSSLASRLELWSTTSEIKQLC